MKIKIFVEDKLIQMLYNFSYIMFGSQSKSAGIPENRANWAKIKTYNRTRATEYQEIVIMRLALK